MTSQESKMAEEAPLDAASSLSLFKKLAVQESNLLLSYMNALSLQTLLTPSRLTSLSGGSSVFTSLPSLPLQVSSSASSSCSSIRSQLGDVQGQMSVLAGMAPEGGAERDGMLGRVMLGERALATVADGTLGTEVKTAALLAVRVWEAGS